MDLILQNIRNIDDLAKYLPVSTTTLNSLANNQYKETLVRIKEVRKYANKFREVAVIYDLSYLLLLKKILAYLNKNYVPPKSVYGYVKNGGIVKNARIHLSKKYILKCDIRNFFYSISRESVEEIFHDLGANTEISIVLSNVTTFRNVLFPGLNTSPVLSNIYCKELDCELEKLAQEFDCEYSRYADDISISSNDRLPDVDAVGLILSRFGFVLNKEKIKIMKRGRYQVITGLTVFDKTIPRIPRNIKKKIRLASFLLSKAKDINEYDEKVKWCKYRYLSDVLKYYAIIEPYFVKKIVQLSKGKLKLSIYNKYSSAPRPPGVRRREELK